MLPGIFLFKKILRKILPSGKIHLERHGKRYHFSWLEVGKDTKFEWEEARNYCRRQCMDSVSIRSKAEMNTIKQALRRDVLRYINTTNSQIFWQIV